MKKSCIISGSALILAILCLSFEAQASLAKENGSPTSFEKNYSKLDTSEFPASKVPRIRIEPNRLRVILSNFRRRTVRIDSTRRLVLGQNDMRHILERHHPRYWARPKPNGLRQTFLDENMTVDEVAEAIEAFASQHRTALSQLEPKGGQVQGLLNGVRYVLGIDSRGRIRQFYPIDDNFL